MLDLSLTTAVMGESRSPICEISNYFKCPKYANKWRSRWKNLRNHSFLLLVLLILCSPGGSLVQNVHSYPYYTQETRDCDWSGRGSPVPHEVQSVYLRCSTGSLEWVSPVGGLRVNFQNNVKSFKNEKKSKIPAEMSHRLCLRIEGGQKVQIFLEQNGDRFERRLLPFSNSQPEDPHCYYMGDSANLYIESVPEDSKNSTSSVDENSVEQVEVEISEDLSASNVVKISYEISKSRAFGHDNHQYRDDEECRPCSDEEILTNFCTTDIAVRGSLVSVRASSPQSESDLLHILADLVIHQNYQVFKPIAQPAQSIQEFIDQPLSTFNPENNTPQKLENNSLKRRKRAENLTKLGGILAHPKKCKASNGPGEFLWLVKLTLGTPRVQCVTYWDKWVELAKNAEKLGYFECPLTY